MRAEAGALSHMQGDIKITARLPSPLSALKSAISNEALVRPSYSGTGTINLKSSMGGYYPFEVTGDSWILENGAYWASEGTVELRLHRERVWTSFWAGEGFIDYQTKVSGYGCVVLNAPGPVEEVTLKDERLMVEGKLVLARTEGLDYRMRHPDFARPVAVLRRGGDAGLPGHRQGAGLLDAVLEPVRREPDRAADPELSETRASAPMQTEIRVVMPGLDPGIHYPRFGTACAWIAGSPPG